MSHPQKPRKTLDFGAPALVRHPKTDPNQADTDPLHLDNVKAQRQLTDEGRRQAKALGEAFRALKIPVGKVVASKFHRTQEAAKPLTWARSRPSST